MVLQQIIATAGYILPNARLDTEKQDLLGCDPGASPLDVYFDINPKSLPEAPASYEYLTVGDNLTITSPVKPSTHPPEN